MDRDDDWYECSRDATHDDGMHCIFHAKKKDAIEFQRAITDLVRQWIAEEADTWDFSGFVFPELVLEEIWVGDITLEWDEKDNPLFPVTVNFRSATFDGYTSFCSTIFSGDAYFDSATFRAGASFMEATFRGNASFKSVAFRGDAYFMEAVFCRDARFMEAKFNEFVFFSRASFSGNAYFGSAVFSEPADFSGATFAGLFDIDECATKIKIRLHWRSEGKKQE